MLDYPSFVPSQRFQPVLELSPGAAEVAYSSNASGQFNLWLQPVSGGPARQLTTYTGNAVRRIAWAPDGTSLVFTADHNGDEQTQIYRISAAGGQPERITTADDRQHFLADAPFDASGRYLAYSANDREPHVRDAVVRDLNDGTEQRFIPPEGVSFDPVEISPDGRWLLIMGFQSNTDQHAYLADLTRPDGAARLVTGNLGEGGFSPACWAPDSRGFYLLTNAWGEFDAAAYMPLDGTALEKVTAADWDAELFTMAAGTMAWVVNEAGRSVLHTRRPGGADGSPSLPAAVIKAMTLARDGSFAVLLIDAATRPAEIAVLDLAGKAADQHTAVRYLTDNRPAGLQKIRPAEPAGLSFQARDGRTIHTFTYRPSGPGPFPVVLSLHGGPEAQERPNYEYAGLYQCLAARGIAVIAPNVAGSTGYGITFQELIHRDWGGVDLRDFEDTLGWACSLEWADREKIAVFGGSYGGFAALSCLARISYPWAAGIAWCAPSNLVTLSRACPPTWREAVNRILGDPDADAELLTERSPIHYADQINAPLLVTQGAKDPRVPKAEADQIVAALRARDIEVAYDVYDDEGHGFTNRSNEIKAFTNMADFLTGHLRPAT